MSTYPSLKIKVLCLEGANLCEIEKLYDRSISAKPNVVTFGVNYDGVFTREAQSLCIDWLRSNILQSKGARTI